MKESLTGNIQGGCSAVARVAGIMATKRHQFNNLCVTSINAYKSKSIIFWI